MPSGPTAGRVSRADTLFQVGAIGVLAVGTSFLLGSLGIVPDNGLVPVVLLAIGLAILWQRVDHEAGHGARGTTLSDVVGGRAALIRLALGAVLVVIGIALLAAGGSSLTEAGRALLPAVLALAGAALILGPWVRRLLDDYQEERRARIRSEERAEVASRIHDSVLQTLALIQRNAGQPGEAVRLARRQERELRSWLFEDAPPVSGTLKAALGSVAADIEDLYEVTVEVVQVGDATMGERLEAVSLAAREALTNAAKFSGEKVLSVYAEIDGSDARVFVRDRGRGFDLAAIPDDRQGIAQSIRGRVHRAGGQTTVTSRPGGGTEVEITMPIEEEL
jgi:signal transduction histidine kinase